MAGRSLPCKRYTDTTYTMSQNFEIDGHSRRFQLAVLTAAVFIVLTAFVAVSAVDGNAGGYGLGGDGGLSGNGDGTTAETGSQNGSPNSGVQDTNGSVGSGSNEWSPGESSPEGLREMLDATNQETTFPTLTGGAAVEDQLSVNSHRSFVDETHFTVGSDQPGAEFWRVNTRDTFSGNGFVDGDTPPPSDLETISDDHPTGGGFETDRLILQQNASQIPVAGQPVAVSIESGVNPDEYAFKHDQGEIIVTNGNGNYSVLPDGVDIRVTTLQVGEGSTGDDGSESQYTTISGGLDPLIAEQSETIVEDSGASTREEKAEAITSHLRSEYDYNASQGTVHSGQGALVEFLHGESGSGGSEQFATAAAVMLRSEDVPTRVVTGYHESAPGSDEGETTLGSMDQHTWVEVYNGDGEWVPYDPTPIGRDDARQAVRNGDESAFDYGVQPSVLDAWENQNTTVLPEAGNQTSNPGFNNNSDIPEPPYNISLAPDPTPGSKVTVTVTKNGGEISGAIIEFNGETVGQTSGDGTLTATVPYTSSLTVTARQPAEASNDVRTAHSPKFFAGAGGTPPGSLAAQDQSETNQSASSRSYDIPTDISVTSNNLRIPGDNITTSVQINGQPVPDVDVFVNGEPVGTTGENGRITFRIPNSTALGESVAVRIERDELVSETTVPLAEPKVQIDPGIVAMPGTDAEVTVIATNGDQEETLSNQTVAIVDGSGDPVLGQREVTTGADGAVTITLPLSNSVVASAPGYGSDVESSLNGLYYNLGALLLAGVLSIGVVVFGISRSGTRIRRIKQRLLAGVLRIASVVHVAAARIYGVWRAVKAKVAWFGKRAWIRIRTLDASGLWIVPARVGKRAIAFLKGIPAGLRAFFTLNNLRGETSRNAVGKHAMKGGNSADALPRGYAHIRKCWRWLVRTVIGRSGKTTQTTVEIEGSAVAAGLPKGPVSRLRKTFQRTEYGFSDPDGDVDEAEAAVDELRGELDGIEEGNE